MKVVAFSLVCLSIVSKCWAEEDNEAVVTLTDKNFDEFIEKHPLALVEFYAPWCGHCKKLAPEYEKAAKALNDKGSDILLGKVDATVEKAVGGRFEVKGYPTLKFFRNGQPTEYDGGRNESGILEWLDSRSKPAVQKLESQSEVDKLKSDSLVLFLYTGEDNHDLFKHFEEVAELDRNAGAFIYLNGPSNTITVFRQDEDAVEYTGEATKDAVVDFIATEQHFLFGPVNSKTYPKISSRDLPLIWACMDKEGADTHRKIFTEVAKTHRSKYSVVWLDSEQFGSHAESSLGVTEFPTLVATLESGRFILDSQDFTVESVLKFLEDAAAGKIEKSLKSEPIPEANDAAVKIVVGKNFEDIIFNSKKDVLLEVYAPWCGHCKKLEPIYDEFAESVSGNDHLIVAKMDGTANESPVENFEWRGFPSLFFIKAGSKVGDKPENFDGERTVDGFMEYVQKHSSQPDFTPTKKRDDL